MFSSITLVFSKAAAGYYEGRNWVQGEVTSFNADGSLQPIDRRTFQINSTLIKEVESRGVSSSDVRVFYTKTKLIPSDSFAKTDGYTTTIDSVPYEVIMSNPWVGLDSDLEHYEVFLIRKRGRV